MMLKHFDAATQSNSIGIASLHTSYQRGYTEALP